MTHDPVESNAANPNQTTRRMPAVTDKLLRADARLKAVRALDEAAAAMEKLHVALQRVDPRDLLQMVDGCPLPSLSFREGATFGDHTAAFTREFMLWAAHMHDENKFERLGTRRWPESHR